MTIYNIFCYFRNGQVDRAKTQAKTRFVILSWFHRRRTDMLRNQVFKHRFFFSKQTRKPADKGKQPNILQQYIFIMSLNSDPEKGSSSLVE